MIFEYECYFFFKSSINPIIGVLFDAAKNKLDSSFICHFKLLTEAINPARTPQLPC